MSENASADLIAQRALELEAPIRRLVELNQQGGRIPEGLRAAAHEYTSRSTRQAFLLLADRIEAGGTPSGYIASDLEKLIAATAANPSDSFDTSYTCPQQSIPEGAADSADIQGNAEGVASSDSFAILAPRVLTWSENLGLVNRALWRIDANLWFATLFLFLGGFVNWLMVRIAQRPLLDMINEFELYIEASTILFLQVLGWVGPFVMLLSCSFALFLLLYRLGPFRPLFESAIYHLPLVGKTIRRLQFALMCDGVSRYLAAGMTYPQALRGTQWLVRSSTLKHWLAKSSLAVEQGGPLVETIKYLPLQGEVLTALVGPVGPSPSTPAVGWRMAADYFRSAGLRGAENARLIVPAASMLATTVGWMGLAASFVLLGHIVSLISSLALVMFSAKLSFVTFPW